MNRQDGLAGDLERLGLRILGGIRGFRGDISVCGEGTGMRMRGRGREGKRTDHSTEAETAAVFCSFVVCPVTSRHELASTMLCKRAPSKVEQLKMVPVDT